MRSLRRIRWGVSTLSLVLITLCYLDFGGHIPPLFVSSILALQVGPAVIKTIGSTGIALIGLGIVALLTLLLGRVYCSHLCPLGTLQDFFIWTAKKNYLHRKFPYRTPPYLLHYGITFILIASALGGSMILLDLFEPFSAYGRIFSGLARPLIIAVNNAAAILFAKQQIYVLYEIPLAGLSVSVVAAALIFVAGLYWMSYSYGRLFCNTLCPVGGLLGLLSRASLFRISIDGEKCIKCGVCERVCKAQCLDSKELRINHAACIGCFDCIGSCPTDGLTYNKFTRKSNKENAVDASRRGVLLSASAGMIVLLKPSAPDSTQAVSYDESRRTPVAAPGAGSIERFSQLCTACHLCISSCPAHVLQPSILEFGLAGILQPRMEYSIGYCTYDCTVCGHVCPTGAILPLPVEEKRLTQIGKTFFVKEDCIVETKKTDCGACAEHCPTKAVKMVPYGKLSLPEVDNQYCVGCGACEHACPTKPRKAIFVQASRIHGVANKRRDQKLSTAPATPEDFPF